MVFLFNFTKLGRKQTFLGGNETCAKLTGISIGLFGIIAFVLAGLGVGLGASMTVVYAKTVSTTTASSIGMSVFIAIVFGGMPISGGPRSRIYAALIGGFSYNGYGAATSVFYPDLFLYPWALMLLGGCSLSFVLNSLVAATGFAAAGLCYHAARPPAVRASRARVLNDFLSFMSVFFGCLCAWHPVIPFFS